MGDEYGGAGCAIAHGATDPAKTAPLLAGMTGLNAVLIVRADGIPGRARVLGAVTSAGFAAGFGYLAARRR